MASSNAQLEWSARMVSSNGQLEWPAQMAQLSQFAWLVQFEGPCYTVLIK